MNPTPETIQLGPLQIRFLVDPATVNQSVAMFEVVVPAGAKVPTAHSHIAYDETIYGLEGTCTFTVSGREYAVDTGATVFIPRGAVHHFVNRGSERVRFLAVVTPGILGPAYFREIAAAIPAGGPPDLKRIGEIMQRHGLQPASAN